MKNKNNVLPWIQSLRGIAALMVVLVHARFNLPGETGRAIAQTFFFPGAMGVDLFFMVSGFIMILTTKESDGTVRYVVAFAIKRIARIWPLYLCVSLITLVLSPEAGWLSDWAHVKGLIRSLLLIPVNADGGLYFGMPVNVSWTLCFEVYFYAVLAVSMLFGRWRWAATMCWFAITLVWYPLHKGYFNLDPFGQPAVHWAHMANAALNPIVWDFVIGLLAGAIYMAPAWAPSARHAQWLYLAIFAAFAWIVMKAIIGAQSPHGITGYGAPLGVMFLALAFLAKSKELASPKWTLWLGDISYSLYLTHLFGFRLSSWMVARLQLADPIKGAMCNFVGSIALGIVTGAVFYNFVEQPLSRYVQKRLMATLPPKASAVVIAAEAAPQQLHP